MSGSPDLQLPARAAIMSALKTSPIATAIVPNAQIYPSTTPANPTWPFIRFASMIVSPLRATGLDSSAFRISIQAFSKDVVDGTGATIMPAEDAVSMIASTIRETLDRSSLPLAGGLQLRMNWIQTRTMVDGAEAAAWMATVVFTGEISA